MLFLSMGTFIGAARPCMMKRGGEVIERSERQNVSAKN